MSRLSIVLVHYHTGELLVRAVQALLADLGAAISEAEILVVDNGSSVVDRARMRGLPVRVLEPGANLGYAGGVALGVEASQAQRLILMNPDVLVLPGCLQTLLTQLDSGAAAAGPRLYWDLDRTLLLPPTEICDRRMALLKLGSHWSSVAERWARRRWRMHALRHWRALRPLHSEALSGALLALRRDAWQDVGPFDAQFRLYFEEVDWLRRAARLGWRSVLVPAAEAVHLFNQSAVHQPRALEWMASSARLYARRHLGAWFAPLAGWRPRLRRRFLPLPLPEGIPRLELPAALLWPVAVEIGEPRFGIPAAVAFLSGPGPRSWSLPADVWSSLAEGWYGLRVVDASGRELEVHHFFRKPVEEREDR